MTKTGSFRLDDLAQRVGGDLRGRGDFEITGLSSLADAGPSDLSFYASDKYAHALARTRAGAILAAAALPDVPSAQILVKDPFLSINELTELFYPRPELPPEGADPLAWVAPSARLEKGARVMRFAHVGYDSVVGARTLLHPGAYVGRDVQIGEDSVLGPSVVVLDGSILGSRVTLHPGAVVGSDGFGFARRDGRYLKIRHVGIVVIEDDVEIGANATIDRGTLGRTLIRRGVKLDNLVHIGHNVEVGEDTVMAAQSGISGSTVIGKRVMMGGQVGLVDHIRVGDAAVVIAQSGVIGDVPPGAMVSGYPARPHREVLKAYAETRSIARLRTKLRELEERVLQLAQLLKERAGDPR